MKICEDCIKRDVCKFKGEVEKYENKVKLPEPLVPSIECEYKRTSGTVYLPDVCTTTTWDDPFCTYTTADNMISN